MRLHPWLLIILLLLTPGAATTAQPQSGGEKKDPYVQRFDELDANGDDHVSLAEWPLGEAKFHLVDRDRDGRLSRGELLTPNVLRRAPWEDRFRELDRDRDGRLSRSEQQRSGATLERADRDRDGYVTPREYGSGFENTWNSRATLPDQRRFRSLDRNRNNRLSRLEWNRSRADFDRLDRNRDGVISPREWQ